MTEPMPELIAPMLAKLAPLPADDSQWATEVKWDGVRAVSYCGADGLRILSRAGNDITSAYPELAALDKALSPQAAILDGEIVAFDDDGRPSFQELQSRIHLRGEAAVERLADSSPVTYMVFDLLWLDGESMLELPYQERRQRLAGLKLDDRRWHVPEFHVGGAAALLAATREHQLEGIVAKRLDSRYLPGKRSGWIKIKNSQRQEVVIGGWTAGTGSRAGTLGALQLGVRDAHGDLQYVGRVGTGFNAETIARLLKLLGPLQRDASPFSGRQPATGAHYVEPTLVCEVEFSEWTHAGTLRQASYKGLRDDKSSVDVVRERPDPGALQPQSEGPAAMRAAGTLIDELLAAGHRSGQTAEIEVEGRTLKLTNLEKVLYPATGFTKLDLIAYYTAVSATLLPHLRDRPLTLKRYPNGVGEQFFYEKRAPKHRPDWVKTVTVTSDRDKPDIPYTLCQDLPTLIWLANLADIELHPSLSLGGAIERPTTLAFDLDPGAPANIVQCCEVALLLRELFGQHKLTAAVKTSGSKGLQVYVPLNRPSATYERTKSFARAAARQLEAEHPALVVSEMAKAKRPGKVLIDWSQNDVHKTTICVYSLRATETPGVSTPISWDEVTACRERNDPRLLAFSPAQVLARIAQDELFSEVLSTRQTAPKLKD